MRVFISNDNNYFSIIKYALALISKNQDIHIEFCKNKEYATYIFDINDPVSLPISISFYEKLASGFVNLEHSLIFKEEPVVKSESGEEDYLATIFYMVNSLQEMSRNEFHYDRIGRFKYDASYQKKFDNIEVNLVQTYIDKFLEDCGIAVKPKNRTSLFISHDIDRIYGSIVEDGFWAIKRGRFDIILKLIFNEMLRKPDWRNIDKIIKIDSSSDIKSTFFWLVNRGSGDFGIRNSDYTIENEGKLLDLVNKNGFYNGLHKSCSKLSINQELQKLPDKTTYNRNHYLRFKVPTSYYEIENSSLEFDASLGFAEKFGFRNSYGLPFQPYNFKERKAFNFIEVPLHIMDGTAHRYMKIPVHQTADRIISFIEKNNENCVLSLCWHNTYFTNYKYKGFLDEYKKLLSFFYESKFKSLTPKDIVEQWKIKK